MTYVRQGMLYRNKKRLLLALGVVVILIPLVLSLIVANEKISKLQDVKLPTSSKESKIITLVRANRSIQAGESADNTKFEPVEVLLNMAPEGAIASTSLLKGKRVNRSLVKNELLLQRDLVDSTAWYEEGDRLMEHTFQNEAIPSTVEVGSVVDIKLFRQKSEDPVVISKIAVVSKVDNTLSFYLNSMEQEFLKEANTEGTLFLVQYLDKTQPASMTTYYPPFGKEQDNVAKVEGFTFSSVSGE